MALPIWRPTELIIDPHTVADIGFQRMRVTSPFGNRPDPLTNGKTTVFHGGLDIGNARLGDWCVADADGTVVAVGNLGWPWSMPTVKYASKNYGGLMVVIEHDGWCSVYAHLQSAVVKPGEKVQLGRRIAKVGESGSAIGQGHLHYGHIMASAKRIATLGSGPKPLRDPWTVIEPLGPPPLAETRLERLRRFDTELRHAKPKATARWLDRTGLTSKDVGEIMTEAMFLSMRVSNLREAPDE